jgi:hypothetical protein
LAGALAAGLLAATAALAVRAERRPAPAAGAPVGSAAAGRASHAPAAADTTMDSLIARAGRVARTSRVAAGAPAEVALGVLEVPGAPGGPRPAPGTDPRCASPRDADQQGVPRRGRGARRCARDARRPGARLGDALGRRRAHPGGGARPRRRAARLGGRARPIAAARAPRPRRGRRWGAARVPCHTRLAAERAAELEARRERFERIARLAPP